MLSLIGLIGGLLLLIVLTIRGMNLFIAAPLCALIVALTSGLPIFLGDSNFVVTYMQGFSGFIAAWFFMFLLGSLFGKFMEDTGAADSLACWIISKLGRKQAVLAVVLACAVLTYGGVSVFVVAFSVYPMALSLFKDANLPRRFIPAALAFGSVTFTMTSAGSPEIQNWIPIKYLGTSPFAGWEVSLVVAIFMASFGFWWMHFKHFHNMQNAVTAGTTGALIAIGNTAAVVGFGSIAKATAAFQTAVEVMAQIPGNELIGAAIAISVIAGLTGSASGGQVIALPLLAPGYLEQGVDPEELHRIVSISSGALDSLPHNGYVVTTIRAICQETHQQAYWALGALTVVVPLCGVALAIALFSFL